MFTGRAYRINPNDGSLEISIVGFGYSEKKLRRRLEKKPGVKKVEIEVLEPKFEETVKAEGLVSC
jgi:hypothetical protein